LNAQEWLDKEDSICRIEHLKHLEWLIENTPNNEYWIFHGGTIAKYLFEETRYCFTYSQFLATIVLGFAFIEHTLAVLLFASGRDDLEKANISKILNEARMVGWLSEVEYQNLLKAKIIRNPITHFRAPLHKESIDNKSVMENKHQYEIIEEDAKYVLKVVLKLVDKNAIKQATQADSDISVG